MDIQEFCSNFQPRKVLANLVKILTINQNIGKFNWYRDGARPENLGGQVYSNAASCQNLEGGGCMPPNLPPASATPVVNLMVKTVKTQTNPKIYLDANRLQKEFGFVMTSYAGGLRNHFSI